MFVLSEYMGEVDVGPDRLGALYEVQSERMLVYFVRRTYDAQMAVDLVGETFARAFAERARFRGESETELAAWVWGIARNLLKDALRRGRAERRAMARLRVERLELSDVEQARIEELAGLDKMRLAVAGAFARLSSDQQQAVRLRVVAELEYAEIARVLGITQATARARVSRGLRALALATDLAEQVE